MNYMKINVLVIGGGTHHNALGVIRTLGISGYGVELICCTANLNQKKKLLFRVLMQLLNI